MSGENLDKLMIEKIKFMREMQKLRTVRINRQYWCVHVSKNWGRWSNALRRNHWTALRLLRDRPDLADQPQKMPERFWIPSVYGFKPPEASARAFHERNASIHGKKATWNPKGAFAQSISNGLYPESHTGKLCGLWTQCEHCQPIDFGDHLRVFRRPAGGFVEWPDQRRDFHNGILKQNPRSTKKQ